MSNCTESQLSFLCGAPNFFKECVFPKEQTCDDVQQCSGVRAQVGVYTLVLQFNAMVFRCTKEEYDVYFFFSSTRKDSGDRNAARTTKARIGAKHKTHSTKL